MLSEQKYNITFDKYDYEFTFNNKHNVICDQTGTGKTFFNEQAKALGVTINGIVQKAAVYIRTRIDREIILETMNSKSNLVILDDCEFSEFDTAGQKRSLAQEISQSHKLLLVTGRNILLPYADCWTLRDYKNVPMLLRPEESLDFPIDSLILLTEDSKSGKLLWKNLNLFSEILSPVVPVPPCNYEVGGIEGLLQYLKTEINPNLNYGLAVDYVYDNVRVLYYLNEIEKIKLPNVEFVSTHTAEELILVDSWFKQNARKGINALDLEMINEILRDIHTRLTEYKGTYEHRTAQYLFNRTSYAKSTSCSEIFLDIQTNPLLSHLKKEGND